MVMLKWKHQVLNPFTVIIHNCITEVSFELDSQSFPCRPHMHICENLRLTLDDIAITDEFFLGVAESFPHLAALTIQD